METETVSSLIKFCEKGIISHSFAIEESVSYKLYIENSSDIRNAPFGTYFPSMICPMAFPLTGMRRPLS